MSIIYRCLIELLIIFLTALLFLACTSVQTNKFINNPQELSICDDSRSFPQLIKIPGFKNAWQMVYDCEVYHSNKSSIALQVFYKHWSLKFGDTNGVLQSALDNIMIEWKNKPTIGSGYSLQGFKIRFGRIKGLTLSPGYIWACAESGQTVCETSLIHELTHVAIWVQDQTTHGDPDHEGPKYKGWTKQHSSLIDSINDELCRLGI